MAITGHWIDSSWQLVSTALGFKWYPTAHTAHIMAVIVRDLILKLEIESSLHLITTDNSADMVAEIRLLYAKLKELVPERLLESDSFHVRCISHMVILAVRIFMTGFRDKIVKIGQLVAVLRSQVRRCDFLTKLVES